MILIFRGRFSTKLFGPNITVAKLKRYNELIKNAFPPEKRFWLKNEQFWLENFALNMIMAISGHYRFDPESLTPTVDWGQKIIWSVNNPSYNFFRQNGNKIIVFTCIFAIIKYISEAHDLIIECFFEFVSSWRWDRRYGSKWKIKIFSNNCTLVVRSRTFSDYVVST